MTWRRSLAPLGNRDFAWFFASRSSDTLGMMMAGVALAFAVLETDDSATALGQVLAAHNIPLVVLLLLGGVIADRVPRTLLIQVSNVGAGVSQAVLALLVITDAAELWMLIVLAAVNGAADAMNFPAQQSVVPQLVPRPQLQSANALLSMSRAVLAAIGPALSGLLVVTVGPGWALAVNAVTWFAAAVLLVPVRLPAPGRGAGGTMLQDLAEGWRLFAGTTWLWVVVLSFSVLNAIQAGAWLTLGPLVARDTIGEQGWGLVLSSLAAGLLVMTVVLLRVPVRRPLLLGMASVSLLGAPIIVLGARPEMWLLVPVAFLAGAGLELFNIGWSLSMQEHVEERLLSRAYSYDALGSFVAMPVGQLVYGPLGDALDPREVLVWSGVAYVLVALSALASRSVRTLDRPVAAG